MTEVIYTLPLAIIPTEPFQLQGKSNVKIGDELLTIYKIEIVDNSWTNY